MKLKLDRIISVATLLASLVAIFLALKKPTPVVQSQSAVASRSESFDPKAAQAEQSVQHPQAAMSYQPATYQSSSAGTTQPSQLPAQAPQSASAASSSPKPDATLGADAVSAMLAKTLGGGASGLGLDANVGSGSPNIKDQQVTMDGDVLHGKFLTEIAGKDVWVTISGHMGEKDGYATFDPTEIKVGDMDVPVSLVNPMLQKKLTEERDRLKVSNNGGQ
jgi:hypothetical protein